MALRLYGNEPASIVALLGNDENSATFALGWVLERCPSFLALFIANVADRPLERTSEVAIDLQRHDEKGGFTDIEVVIKDLCHLIVEAKCGWAIPGHDQLETYCRRLSSSSKAVQRMVSLSAATRGYAARRLPDHIADLPVAHRSWSDVKQLAEAAYRKASGYEERLWLSQLCQQLESYVSMQDPHDNIVYVVSLSADAINEGDGYTWIDVIEMDMSYFHPVGNRWPVFPPNYIGFRYHGGLQAVHHIEGYEVISDVSERNNRWPKNDTDHFVYKLGPAMKPSRRMPTGKIFRNHRVRCAIDTLLSGACETISDARAETNRRLNHEQMKVERGSTAGSAAK